MYNNMHKRDALTAPQGTWSKLGVCDDIGTAAIMSAARHRDRWNCNPSEECTSNSMWQPASLYMRDLLASIISDRMRMSSLSGTCKYTILGPMHRRVCRTRRSVNVPHLWKKKAWRPSCRIKVTIDSWRYKYWTWNLLACKQQYTSGNRCVTSLQINGKASTPFFDHRKVSCELLSSGDLSQVLN